MTELEHIYDIIGNGVMVESEVVDLKGCIKKLYDKVIEAQYKNYKMKSADIPPECDE
jgi:hypothetical protein